MGALRPVLHELCCLLLAASSNPFHKMALACGAKAQSLACAAAQKQSLARAAAQEQKKGQQLVMHALCTVQDLLGFRLDDAVDRARLATTNGNGFLSRSGSAHRLRPRGAGGPGSAASDLETLL
jgi:hypothetical protein